MSLPKEENTNSGESVLNIYFKTATGYIRFNRKNFSDHWTFTDKNANGKRIIILGSGVTEQCHIRKHTAGDFPVRKIPCVNLCIHKIMNQSVLRWKTDRLLWLFYWWSYAPVSHSSSCFLRSRIHCRIRSRRGWEAARWYRSSFRRRRIRFRCRSSKVIR